jgi:hypothetical protein
MNLSRPAALAAALALALPAVAADAPKGSADELARLLMPRTTWEQGMQSLAAGVQQRMQMHPGAQLQYPPDFQKKVRAEIEAALPYESLVGLHAKELGASYQESELKDLLAFYRSPTGQKSLQVMPQLSEKVTAATRQQVDAKMPAIMERLGAMAKAPAGSKAAPGSKPAADASKKPADAAKKPAEKPAK